MCDYDNIKSNKRNIPILHRNGYKIGMLYRTNKNFLLNRKDDDSPYNELRFEKLIKDEGYIDDISDGFNTKNNKIIQIKGD